MNAQEEHENLFNIANYQGTEKQLCLFKKLLWKKKKINASEDRKKTQPLYTFGGNVKEVSLNS